jgi:hypothetical protein
MYRTRLSAIALIAVDLEAARPARGIDPIAVASSSERMLMFHVAALREATNVL